MGGFSTVPYYVAPDEEDDSFGSGLTSAYRAGTSPDTNDSAAPLPSTTAAAVTAPGAGVTPGIASPAQPALQPPVYQPADRTKLNDWENKRVADSQVTNIQDSKYSPRWWERVLGGVASGAMAFGHVPGAVEGGSSITDRRYNQGENERVGRLAADNAGIQSETGNINDVNQQFERRLQGFNADSRAQSARQLEADRRAQEQGRLQAIAPGTEAPDDPNNPLGSWHATTVGGQPIKGIPPPDKYLKTPQGIAATRHAELDQLKQQGHKFSPEQETFYLTNGRIHEPVPSTSIHIPSEGQQAYSEAVSAWKRENPGRQPGTEDLKKIRAAADGREVTGTGGGKGKGPGGRGTPNQFKTLDKETASQYAKAEAQFNLEMSTAASPEEKAVALSNLNAEKTRIGAVHSDQLRDLGGIPAEDSGDAGQPQQAPPAAPARPQATPASQPARQPATPAAPTERVVNGPQGKITVILKNNQWVNKKTGKPL